MGRRRGGEKVRQRRLTALAHGQIEKSRGHNIPLNSLEIFKQVQFTNAALTAVHIDTENEPVASTSVTVPPVVSRPIAILVPFSHRPEEYLSAGGFPARRAPPADDEQNSAATTEPAPIIEVVDLE